MPIRVTDQGGAGPAGPAGPVGPAGPIAPGIELIFRPGGVTAGRTYATWAALMADVTPIVLEPKTIFFDDTLGACTIPAGAYDMGRNTVFAGMNPPLPAGANRVTVTCPNGVTFTTPIYRITFITLTYTGAGNLMTIPADGRIWRTLLDQHARLNPTNAAGVIFKLTAGAVFGIDMSVNAVLLAGGGQIWNVDAGAAVADLTCQNYGPSTMPVPPNVLTGAAGPLYEFAADRLGLISTAQAGMPGGVIGPISFYDTAPTGPYTPSIAADWTPAVPATVQDALDSLAARTLGNAFIFRPGGVTAGRTYATWAALMTAVATVLNEPKTIYFDDTLGAAVLPAAAQDFGRECTLAGIYPVLAGNRVEITCPNGCTFTSIPVATEFVQVTYTGLGFLMTVPGDGRIYRYAMRQGARLRATNAAGCCVSVPAGAIFTFDISDNATLVAGGGQIWNVAAGAVDAEILIWKNSSATTVLPANVLTGLAGPTYAFTCYNLSLLTVTQAGMPGGVITPSFIFTAARQPYTPATATNWNPVPTALQGTLDQMGRVQGGTATLAAGVTAAIAANISANSRIICTLKNPNTHALTVDYAALAADRVNGSPGSFKLTAIVAAGTINVADVSDLDWLVFGG